MYVVVLLFLSGMSGHPQHQVVRCPDMPCVQDILDHANESPNIARIRVWKTADFAPLDPGKQFVWPAMIDLQYH
jgi:hypothetical protein